MVRTILRPALALGAVLAVGGYATADDTLRVGGPGAKSGFGANTLSLIGQGTIADAAAEDTELAGYRYGGYRTYGGYGGRYYGGYGRYYGGYGRYYGGYARYFGGYGYRPFYPTFRPYFYRPYYTSFYFRPHFRPYYGGFYGVGFGGYYGGYSSGFYGGYSCISGSLSDPVPTVTLTLSSARTASVVENTAVPVIQPRPILPPAQLPDDGIPTFTPNTPPPVRPVTPTADEIPVSLKTRQSAKPYTYKAYGEK